MVGAQPHARGRARLLRPRALRRRAGGRLAGRHVRIRRRAGGAVELARAPPPTIVPVDGVTGLPPPPPAPTFSGTITITRRRKRVVADNIAPEDILFTPTARDQDKASFLGFRKRVTASDLVEMGLGQDEVDELRSDRDLSPEQAQRTASAILNEAERGDLGDSERPLWLVVAYVRADNDGDGVSELLRVVYAHAGGTAGRVFTRVSSGSLLLSPLPPAPLLNHPILSP